MSMPNPFMFEKLPFDTNADFAPVSLLASGLDRVIAVVSTTEKGKVAFALSEASRVLQSLHPDTYPMADSWVKAVKNKADISPGKLADRAGEAPLAVRRVLARPDAVRHVGLSDAARLVPDDHDVAGLPIGLDRLPTDDHGRRLGAGPQ